MNIGRRMFAALLPAAPVAARAGIDSVVQRATPEPSYVKYAWQDVGAEIVQTIAEPAGLKPYWAAREAASASNQYRYNFRDIQRNPRQSVCLNIQSLRSVSPVMKMHMELNRRYIIDREERTWSEALMDRFGVRDWFKNQQLTDKYPAAETRRGY